MLAGLDRVKVTVLPPLETTPVNVPKLPVSFGAVVNPVRFAVVINEKTMLAFEAKVGDAKPDVDAL